MSQAEDPRRTVGNAGAREVTVEDVRELIGASTPHFALQLRNRIAALIIGLPAGHPARVEGEREIARLERLSFSGETRWRAGGTQTSAPCPRSAQTLRVSLTHVPAPTDSQFASAVRFSPAPLLPRQRPEANVRSRRASRKRARSSLKRITHSAASTPSSATFKTGGSLLSVPTRRTTAERSLDHGQQREDQRVRAVAAEVLAQRHLERPRSRPRRGRRTGAARRGSSSIEAHEGADRAYQDQQLGEWQRMPWRPRSLADGKRVSELLMLWSSNGGDANHGFAVGDNGFDVTELRYRFGLSVAGGAGGATVKFRWWIRG